MDKFAFAFRQIAVRQPGLRSFQILEERDSFHHLVAGPTAHGRYHGCVSLIRPKLQKAKSRKIVHPVRALRSIRFSSPVTLTSLIPNVVSPRQGRNQREPMAMINAMNDRGRESAGIARPPTGSRTAGRAASTQRPVTVLSRCPPEGDLPWRFGNPSVRTVASAVG